MTDSEENLDTVFSQSDIKFLNDLRLSKYAVSDSAPIDWSTFRMVTSSHEESLLVSPFQPDKSFYENYRGFLKYSPDSSMFVDIDSYNIEIHQDKNGWVSSIEKGPDTEVSLVNLAEKNKTRLVFLGPGNGVEDASWIDDRTILLIGYQEGDSAKMKKAVIWRYHIPTKTFHVYESLDPSTGSRILNWRKTRFRQ
ncbi:MAG: hypothetical protein ACXWCG_11950 [Flavitalea sp.]